MISLSLSWTCQRDGVSLLIKFGLNKNNFILKSDNDVASSREVNKKSKAKMIMVSLSLSWTCQGDRILLIVKFGLNKNNFI